MAFSQELITKFLARDVNTKKTLNEFKDEFNDFKKNANESFDEVEKGESKFLKLAGGVGAATAQFVQATAVVVGFTKTVALAATVAAAKKEKIVASFRAISGSIEDARHNVRLLKEFSIENPLIDPTDIREAGRQLLAFDFQAGRVPGTLRMIGDLALATGTDFRTLAEIISRAKELNKADMEDINRLIDRNIPIIGELAKVLGVTRGEIKDMVADGAVDFDVLMRALHNLTDEGGRFHGVMEDMGNTTISKFHEMRKRFGDLVTQMAELIGNTLLPSLNKLLDKLNDIMERALAGEGAIGGMFKHVRQFIAEEEARNIQQAAEADLNALGKELNRAVFDNPEVMRSLGRGLQGSTRFQQSLFGFGVQNQVESGQETIEDIRRAFGGNVPTHINELLKRYEAAIGRGVGAEHQKEIEAGLDRLAKAFKKQADDLEKHGEEMRRRQRDIERNAPKGDGDFLIDMDPPSIADWLKRLGQLQDKYVNNLDVTMHHNEAFQEWLRKMSVVTKFGEGVLDVGVKEHFRPNSIVARLFRELKAEPEKEFHARFEGLTALHARIQAAAASKRDDPALAEAKKANTVLGMIGAKVATMPKGITDAIGGGVDKLLAGLPKKLKGPKFAGAGGKP